MEVYIFQFPDCNLVFADNSLMFADCRLLVTTKDVQLYSNWNIIQDEKLHLKLDMNLNPKPNLELNLKLNLAPNMKLCGYQKQKVYSVHRFQSEENGLKIAVYRLQFAGCRLLVY